MRAIPILVGCVLLAGCANQAHVAQTVPAAPVFAAVAPTKLVETRYDVRGYQDSANPSLRHEAHAVYRRTRVAASASDDLATAPRTTFAPASVSPLPASEELAAELASQKAITAELRAMQANMAETQQRMQKQYGQLVKQSEEAKSLREQMHATQLQAPATHAGNPPTQIAENTAEAKW